MNLTSDFGHHRRAPEWQEWARAVHLVQCGQAAEQRIQAYLDAATVLHIYVERLAHNSASALHMLHDRPEHLRQRDVTY